jgi:alpha-ribazole phosphatase
MADRVVITLFRHRLTEANMRKAYLGWTDSPLCVESNKNSTDRRYDRYFSSDLMRCYTTAEQLFPRNEITLLENLREMNFGSWEGKTYDDLKGDKQYQLWLTDPFYYSPPNGESFQKFTGRVQTGWKIIVDQLSEQSVDSCAVVTHGGVIRYLLTQFAPFQKDFWDWQVSHDQGIEMIFEKEALWRGDRCTLLQAVPLTENEHG